MNTAIADKKAPLPAKAISALREIGNAISGDVHQDKLWRMLYASDASIYQTLPWAVILPRSESDCIEIRKIAEAYQIPLIARGAGTSLAGQVVGEGFILDLSRYMNRIISIDYAAQQAVVEPGVVVSVLNQAVAEKGLMFAPDPSTLTRANIAGLIGNNAWGAHSPIYGETVDHIISLSIVLATAEVMLLHNLTEQGLAQKLQFNNAEGKIYQTVYHEIEQYKALIKNQYLNIDVPNNVGYAIDKVLNQQPWNSSGAAFSLVPLICGSEGTLGIITQATVKLRAKPTNRLMIAAHFNSLKDALHATGIAKAAGAVAIELLDEVLISLVSPTWLDKKAKALLLIELQSNELPSPQNKALTQNANTLLTRFKNSALGYHFPLLTHTQLDEAWATRRSALGLLMGMDGAKKAVTFIEDSAVPVDALPQFVAQVQAVMASHQVACVYYGSVSRGLVHLRPLLNLKEINDRSKLDILSREILALLMESGGSLSAKHGDGKARGAYIEQQIGSELYASLHKIKKSFDPNNILNPGKLFDCPPINAGLRATAISPVEKKIEAKPIQTFFDWSANGGLIAAVEKCNGAAVCRRQQGTGAMCPSYQASQLEKDTTRGRANVFRQLLADPLFKEAICDEALHEVLELCLGCKSCKTECPAGVDMARLKAEHLQHYYQQHSKPLISKLIQNLEKINLVASKFPGFANVILSSQIIKSIFSVHNNRTLPQLSSQRLSHWFKQYKAKQSNTSKPDVILLNNVFSEFYDVSMAQKAILSLQKLGYIVALSPFFPSLRLPLSQGLVEQASTRLHDSLDYLHARAIENIPMIGLEPSEILTYRDEASALCFEPQDKKKVDIIAKKIFLFEEFISRNAKDRLSNITWPTPKNKLLVHVHCHQRAIAGLAPTKLFNDMIPSLVAELTPPGCCGMAGFFGYDRQKYDLSMDIGRLTLFPRIDKAASATIIVASGFSCRHQIMHGTNRQVLHPAEMFYQALGACPRTD